MGGVYNWHFQITVGRDGGEGWEEAVHVACCVAHVTREHSHFISFHLISSHFISFHLISSHFILLHCTLPYLAVGIVGGGLCGIVAGGEKEGVPVVGLSGSGIELSTPRVCH